MTIRIILCLVTINMEIEELLESYIDTIRHQFNYNLHLDRVEQFLADIQGQLEDYNYLITGDVNDVYEFAETLTIEVMWLFGRNANFQRAQYNRILPYTVDWIESNLLDID